MLGILVAIGLTVWFFRTARSAGKNPWAWAAAALASYYIPALLWSVVLRAIIPSLDIKISSDGGAVVFGLMVGLSAVVVGGLSAVLVRRNLLLTGSSPASEEGASGSAEKDQEAAP